MPASTAAAMMELPGSEMPGIPASETRLKDCMHPSGAQNPRKMAPALAPQTSAVRGCGAHVQA